VTGPTCPTTDVGLGWLSVTLRAWTANGRGPLLRQLVHAVGEDDARPRQTGIKGYPQALDVLDCSAVGWTDDRPTEVHLTLKQTDCTWERFDRVMAVADGAESWKVARLDLNVDDVARRATAQDVLQACQARNVVTRADVSSPEVAGRGAIQSVYIGSRASDRHLCVYDKDAERAQAMRAPIALGTHGVRWELRLRDQRATAAARACRSSRGLRDFWHQVLLLVDFRERSTEVDRRHGGRRSRRLDWFAELVGDQERQPPYAPRVPEDEYVRAWRLRRWVVDMARPLAEVAEVEPEWFMRELMAEGFRKLADRRARATQAVA
jgi:Replication initiation factor